MNVHRTYKTVQLQDFDGVQMPSSFVKTKEKIENMKVSNDDVWVTSYPKSGTTWTQELVWLLMNDLDYEGAKLDLDIRYNFVEGVDLRTAAENFHTQNGLYVPSPSKEFLKMLEENQSNKFFKTHLCWNLLPKQIREEVQTPKIIHVIRNPKQIVCSYYHHATVLSPVFLGELDDFVDLYMKGEFFFGDYFKVILSYWNKRHLPNLLLLTYEEMKADLKGVIKKVATFLGKSYNEEDLLKLAHHLSFDEMKNNKAVNKQIMIQNNQLSFMRDGTVDSYKRELSREVTQKMDQWIANNLKDTDLIGELDWS